MKSSIESVMLKTAAPVEATTTKATPDAAAVLWNKEESIRKAADAQISKLREERAAIVAIQHPLSTMLAAREQLLAEVERCRVARVYHVEQAADFQAKLDACFRTEGHPQYHQSVFVQNHWQVPSARMVVEIDRFIAAGADKRAECEREICAYAEKHSLQHLVPADLR